MEYVIPLPHIIDSEDMRSKIIRIGNSLGIIIPSKVLKEMSLKESDILALEMRGDRIIIESLATASDPFASLPKGGWYNDPRDSWEIADELHASRVNSRIVESL